jgi:hypothetical protein
LRNKHKLIQPPKLTWEYIRNKAEEFRKKYIEPIFQVPVPIIEVVELKLRIHPNPIVGLRDKIDIDGFLTNDLKSLCIDKDIYEDIRQEKRLRFTFAHELGHLILHENEIRRCQFRTAEDWIHFRDEFSEDDLNWFESHAYEFAGRLLVPREVLISELQKVKEEISIFRSQLNDEDELIESIARILSAKFQVSHYVIQKRIRKEKAWERI